MSLKDDLIKLGERQPDLQNHIRPVLDRFSNREVVSYGTDPSKFQAQVESFVESVFDEMSPDPSIAAALDDLKVLAKDVRKMDLMENVRAARSTIDDAIDNMDEIQRFFDRERRSMFSNRVDELREKALELKNSFV